MAMGIGRVGNVGGGGVSKAETHNERKYEEKDLKVRKNIDPSLSHQNISWNCKDGYITEGTDTASYEELINERFEKLGIKPRSNSVHAVEFMFSCPRDVWKERKDIFDSEKGTFVKNTRPTYEANQYLKECVDWVAERHGKENVMAWSIHNDEPGALPHIHMMVTPIVQKTVRWKNRNGEGEKLENRLCVAEITGGRDVLRKFQDDFHEHVKDKYSEYADWYRGTKKEHQNRAYSKQTSHEIGMLRKELSEMKDEVQAKLILMKIDELNKVKVDNRQQMQRDRESHQHKMKNEGWKTKIEDSHLTDDEKKQPKFVEPKEPLAEPKEKLTEPKPKHTKQKPAKGGWDLEM